MKPINDACFDVMIWSLSNACESRTKKGGSLSGLEKEWPSQADMDGFQRSNSKSTGLSSYHEPPP